MHKSPRRASAALFLIATVASLRAATTPSAPAPAPAAKESPVTLTPFEVTAGSEVGYESSTAMSGTRTNESLANLPNSISVLN
ncbi:MAG: hypothetical protein ACKOE8_12425, partial [Opitutaceae bacterium]